MMKQTLFAATMLSAMTFGFTASAQGLLDMNAPLVGKEAGTFMLRARAVGVIPEDNSSSISTIGGHVTATAQAAPELDLSYFLTDNIALELIAATTRHNVKATNTADLSEHRRPHRRTGHNGKGAYLAGPVGDRRRDWLPLLI
jgi:outer membrane protein